MAAEGQEKLKTAIMALVRRYSSVLARLLETQPELLDKLLDALTNSLREEIESVLSKTEGPIKEIADRLYQELDKDEVIAAIASPLANAIITLLRTDRGLRAELMSVLAREFMNLLDFEEFAHEVAEQVAERVAKQVRIQVPPFQ